ncbi:conserved hypothetical protein [Trichinella spiralis]|uniref:hypothetical protein n=1 Tax=Trichinella spiralis TaxID=6334 RepID=UPI0001EFE2AD|nr:conserved hypothetical protein [Trichinella spiralis]
MSFRYKQLRQRFQRTLYYTKNQKIDQLSYPLTNSKDKQRSSEEVDEAHEQIRWYPQI